MTNITCKCIILEAEEIATFMFKTKADHVLYFCVKKKSESKAALSYYRNLLSVAVKTWAWDLSPYELIP